MTLEQTREAAQRMTPSSARLPGRHSRQGGNPGGWQGSRHGGPVSGRREARPDTGASICHGISTPCVLWGMESPEPQGVARRSSGSTLGHFLSLARAVGERTGEAARFISTRRGTMTLRQYLKETGKRASEIARDAGVHPSTISRHLNGQCRLTPYTANRIREATEGACTWVGLFYPERRQGPEGNDELE